MTEKEYRLRVAVLCLLVVIAIQLGGIWWELRAVRNEQVKSYYAVLPNASRHEMNEVGRRSAQSTLYGIKNVNRVELLETIAAPVQIEP
ncbi:MAG: hypothetical protein ACRD5F_00515 [Candidatus Acidiferrales bacterium]